MPVWPDPLARAYAECEALARSHYENFPVASRLLPAPMRPHIAAVYAFARVADDIADEGHDPAEERRRRLREWGARLQAELGRGATAAATSGSAGELERDRAIMTAVAHTIHMFDLPVELFDDLLSAFGQDTTTNRYASWPDLLEYCRRSANPIGRLVLRIAGYRSGALDRSSDALCTALQLTNFWQDFGRDWRAGRLYVPRETLTAFGADEADLARGVITPAWTQTLGACVRVTEDLFERGRLVCDGVHGRLRYELRATWLGGQRILERVSAHRAELMERRPALGAADVPTLLWRTMRWETAA